MRAVFLILLGLCGAIALQAQPSDTLVVQRSLPLSARRATTDQLGNLYLVTAGNALEKYTPEGLFLTRFTNNRLGAIQSVDVSNPLKVLVWYADFRTVVFLDRSLTPLGELHLIDAGYPEVRTVAAAADGNLWVYDETSFKLSKLSAAGTPLYESQDLNLILNHRLQISSLYDDGVRVLAADPLHGLYCFDPYAQYLRTAPMEGVAEIRTQGDTVACLGDGVFFTVQLPLLEIRQRALPEGASMQRWLGAGQLLVQQKDSLWVLNL
ncbi:MAG: hypothetical protein U0U46_08415 [Saprospiraceae bacterium]